MRIYCKDCKYYRFTYSCGIGGTNEECHVNKIKEKGNYYQPYYYWDDPSYKNKNNDCKDYEEIK